MSTVADSRRVFPAAEPKAELIVKPMNIAVADGGGNLATRVLIDSGWAYCLIGACAVMFSCSAVLGQQAEFQGSVPTGVASPTSLSLTLRDAIDVIVLPERASEPLSYRSKTLTI